VGDVVLGLASAGVHSNGFSLVRKVIERAGLTPKQTGWSTFQRSHHGADPLVCEKRLGSIGKPTHQGLGPHHGWWFADENIPRVLPDGLAAHLRKGSWPQTELFAWLQATAGIDDLEMNRTFNNGIGMVVVVDADNAQACADTLRAQGEQVHTIGVITERDEGAAVVVT
jgi:phosphoribosylformylglycinamidine cyclo-ligase